MKVIFMGTPAAAVPTLRRLIEDGHEVAGVYTQPDRPSGRGNKITFSPVKSFAVEHSIAVFQPTKLRTAETLDQIKGIGAEVIVVVAYGRILPESILNAAVNGAVNVHFSLLPKYRGAAPVNWAIANGETRTGITTMKMDAGLDTGDILLVESLPIRGSETAPELTARLSMLGADLLSRTISNLQNIVPEKQDHSNATTAPILSKADGNVDWREPANVIERRFRAFQPFPGCFTFLNGVRISLKALHIGDSSESAVTDEPGTLRSVSHSILRVTCGSGTAIDVAQLQPEGKRTLTAREFLNGHRLSPNERFASK